jgi:FAD/FMN-containing dehydrogenase
VQVPTNEFLIVVDQLRKFISFDEKHQLLTVESGVSNNEIIRFLYKKGFCIPSNTVYTSGRHPNCSLRRLEAAAVTCGGWP